MFEFDCTFFWHDKCDSARLSQYDRTRLHIYKIRTAGLINPVLFYSTRKEHYITLFLFTVTVLVKRLDYPLLPFFFTSTCTVFTGI